MARHSHTVKKSEILAQMVSVNDAMRAATHAMRASGYKTTSEYHADASGVVVSRTERNRTDDEKNADVIRAMRNARNAFVRAHKLVKSLEAYCDERGINV